MLVAGTSWGCQTVTATQPTWYTALESESQTCMFWGAYTVEHTNYGCRIHSHAFIQPFLYEVSELVSLTVNSFECPRKTPNILTSTLKMDGGCVF